MQASAVILGGIGISGLAWSCREQRKTRFKYAFCNEILQEFSWPEQCRIIGEAGYEGVEIAPFTLVKEGVQEIGAAKRQEMVRDMKNAGIECAGLHWLFVAPPKGLHFTTPDQALRQKSVDYLDKLIDFCGDLGGKVMIFGSPQQRGSTGGISKEEATKNYADGLAKVADHARDRGVTILIEPLSKEQTDVINTMAEAMEIVRQVDHPAISTMFDYHNTADETEPLHQLVRKHIDHIQHVHVQNMDGTVVRSNDIPEELVRVFIELKNANYKKWVSVEVFDFSPGGKYIAEENMKSFLEIEKRIMG